MADYALVYLNYRGRAELIRFIFAQAGINYDDTRVDPEKWPEMRPKTQYGILPYLEIKSAGKTITGNATIARYLADIYNLGGSDEVESSSLSAIVEVCEDLWTRIHSLYWMKDDVAKAGAKKVMKESYIPVLLAKLEAQIVCNGSDEGWIATNKVTYADFAVYVLLECLTPEMEVPLADTFPHLARLMEAVQGLERVKQWIDTRPVTAY